MTPNFAHKIVHSSAMYYQNLIIIHECSKKLLKMKNSKSFFLHLIQQILSMYLTFLLYSLNTSSLNCIQHTIIIMIVYQNIVRNIQCIIHFHFNSGYFNRNFSFLPIVINAVVTPLRKVATYEPRIEEKLHELGKSKRITGH